MALALVTVECPALAEVPGLEDRLAGLVEDAVASPGAPPRALLRVKAPRLGVDWAGAAGATGAPGGQQASAPTADGTLRIASNTKTYVAAAVLRLAEDGRLDLESPVERLLRPATVATLRAGGYRPDAITVRMLLNHTSGLHDYASDDAYLARVMSDPGHRWTRAEQVAWAMSAGAPYGAPAEVYRYSDTGYLLLGEILETVTGRPTPTAVRSTIGFERLGLEATWFETLEPEPARAPPRIRQFSDGVDISAIDASADLYGGGGLVATLRDMLDFYRALLQGRVFSRSDTLATMLEPSPQSLASGEGGYGMGLAHLRLRNGVACYGHGGFWGTDAWHCPSMDVTVVGAVVETAGRAALQTMTRKALELTLAEIERDVDDPRAELAARSMEAFRLADVAVDPSRAKGQCRVLPYRIRYACVITANRQDVGTHAAVRSKSL